LREQVGVSPLETVDIPALASYMRVEIVAADTLVPRDSLKELEALQAILKEALGYVGRDGDRRRAAPPAASGTAARCPVRSPMQVRRSIAWLPGVHRRTALCAKPIRMASALLL